MADAFWGFSLALYARPSVPETCLTLQDSHGADVNLVLFGLWCGLEAGRIEAETLTEAMAMSEAWAARAVRPLRALRRDLKSGVAEADGVIDVEGFRNQVKELELEAERRQQIALAGLALRATPPPGPDAALANFRAYRSAAPFEDGNDAEAGALFATLLAGAQTIDA